MKKVILSFLIVVILLITAGCAYAVFESEKSGKNDEAVGKISEELRKDHRNIRNMILSMRLMAESPEKIDLKDVKTLVDFAKNYIDNVHNRNEEKFLYPVMEKHGVPKENGSIGIILSEHEYERFFMEKINQSIVFYKTNPFKAREEIAINMIKYINLLEAHIYREETVMYKMADQLIDKSEQKIISKEFNNTDKSICYNYNELIKKLKTKYIS